MNQDIASTLVNYAGEIATFLITAGLAWIKRRYDLKQIEKDNAQREYFRK